MNTPAFHELQAVRDADAYSELCTRSDAADRFAFDSVTGSNIDLTADTLCQFVMQFDENRAPLLVKSNLLLGPISSAELLKFMLNRRNSDAQIAAATRELAARYLDDDYTKRVILSCTREAM